MSDKKTTNMHALLSLLPHFLSHAQRLCSQIAKLPRSFTVTSTGEAALAKFLGEYERAYTELYRHRRPLYLLPLNECGVPKFVCTTVCYNHPFKLSVQSYDMCRRGRMHDEYSYCDLRLK